MPDSSSLRLRLVVRRHGLPETKIVFILPLEGDPTISKLLELVNDLIPLESADWGLEDYAVELRGSFECLHFQPVRSVIEKDEEVVIRPLLTDDIRRRRVSGRLQITSDGKHLIDGVPFGRPLLKRPRARPQIQIEPRKRARVTYGEEELDDVENEGGEEPLLLTQYGEAADSEDPSVVRLTSTFDDADALDLDEQDGDFEGGDEDDEDDADYNGDEDDLEGPGSDIEEDELLALQEDLGEDDDMDTAEPRRGGQGRKTASPAAHIDLETLDKITALKQAFQSCDTAQCEGALRRHRGNEVQAYRDLARTHDSDLDLEDMLLLYRKSLQRETQVRFEDDEALDDDEDDVGDFGENRSDDNMDEDDEDEDDQDDADSLVRHFDRHGLPPGSITNGTALDFMAAVRNGPPGQPLASRVKRLDLDDEEETAPTPPQLLPQDPAAESSDDSSSSEDSSSDSDSDSSGDSSEDEDRNDEEGSDSDDDSDGDFGESDSGDSSSGDDSSDDDSDDSSCDSSDDSSSDSAPEETSSKKSPKKAPKNLSLEKSAGESRSTSHTQSASLTHDSSPKDDDSNATGVTPGQGKLRTKLRNARRRAAERARKAGQDGTVPSEASESAPKPSGADAEFLARKAALLASLGGPAKDAAQTEQPEASKVMDNFSTSVSAAPTDSPKPTEDVESTPADEDTPRRRMRLDMGAGRRMLFGALGLRNPKTKADEDKLRSDLMKDVRPLTVPKSQETADPSNTEEVDEDPEAWRKKINLSAVECVQEGVELSEPPFPFVQRWDPQQQYSWHGNRGKGKRKQRNQSQFYEEGESRGAKKQRTAVDDYEASSEFAGFDDSMQLDADVTLNYDDEEPAAEHEDDVEDLPVIPDDVDSLPSLSLGAAKPQMIITWKQLLLSKATNWEPKVVNLTAMVLGTQDDGAQLQVRLAMRDRDEKTYDEDTGERVYDRHEALEVDEEDQEDDGLRDLAFAELMEPRVLQQPAAEEHTKAAVSQSEVIEDSQPCNGTAQNGAGSLGSDAVNFSRAIEEWQQGKEGGKGSMSAPSTEGLIPETYHDEVSKSNSTQPAQQTSDAFISQDQDHLDLDMGDSPSLIAAPHESSDLDSPSQQLEETSQAWVSERASHEPLVDSDFNPNIDQAPHAPTSNNNNMQSPILDDPVVSADSINSGRQPDPDLPLDVEPESLQSGDHILSTEESKTLRPDQEKDDGNKTPTRGTEMHPSGVESVASSPGSLPSLSEVWLSASQSRSTQESAKSDAASEKKFISPEKLVEVKKSSTPPTVPKTRRQRAAAKSQGSEPPTGSQVIALLSSSPEPEPEYTENYADDSVDETYALTKSPPVKATKSAPRRQRMKRVSLAPSSLGSNAGSKRSISSSHANMSALSVLNARRKVSAKF